MVKKSKIEDSNDNDIDTLDESDSDYTEHEKELLDKVRNKRIEYSDSENEVLDVGGQDESSDEDQSEIALSDVEGQEENDDLPNERAWGKDKRKYYSTDYVDQDYGGFEGKDAQLAEFEEEEARNLQKQLAQQLDDDDFNLDVFSKKTKTTDGNQNEEIIKTDLTKLSKRQKLQLLEKESPEFFGLVEDFQTRMKTLKNYLQPVLQKYRKGQIPNCAAIEFVQTQHKIILNYSTNIYMYLLLKCSKSNLQSHPVVKRLYQYRQLLIQLDSVFEEIIKPQIDLILIETAEEETEKLKIEAKKKLKLLSSITNSETKTTNKKKKSVTFNDEFDELPTKKVKMDTDSEESDSNKVADDNMDTENLTKEEAEKRAITYQMAKNKGLTPHRKKEQRNPRVKHRQKFRKALIRRKGAVREPRRELTRYGGEISGIKATVSKSIKLKS